MVEVNCETDFATDEFKQLAKDPGAPHREPLGAQIPEPRRDRPGGAVVRAAYLRGAGPGDGQARRRGSEDRRGQAQETFYAETVLLDQPYVKDDSKTIQQLLDEMSSKVGRASVRSVSARRGDRVG